jgi:hypothetical protein
VPPQPGNGADGGGEGIDVAIPCNPVAAVEVERTFSTLCLP